MIRARRFPRPASSPILAVAAALLALASIGAAPAATPSPAAAALHTKILGVPATIVAGQPFSVAFKVRNDGDATPYAQRVSFVLPTDILLAEPPPDCFAAYAPEAHAFVYEGQIAAYWERACNIRLVAVPDASNHATFSAAIFSPPDRWSDDTATADIVTAAAPAAFSIAGIGVTRAGSVVLGLIALWAIAAGVVYARTRGAERGPRLLSRRRRAVSGVTGFVIALGFLIEFAVMAWDDWRTLHAYKETRCEILDSTLKRDTASGVTTPFSGAGRMATLDVYKPMLSLRYVFDGMTRQSLGFSTDSRLSHSAADIGAIVGAYHRGQTLACWVDPDQPGRVVVIHGFGGAYIFAVFPVLLLVYAAWLWDAAKPRRY